MTAAAISITSNPYKPNGSLAYVCSICGKSTPIQYPSEAKEVCPTCARLLKKMLYGDDE